MAFRLHDLGQHPDSTESVFNIGIIREKKEEITEVLLESQKSSHSLHNG